MGLRMTKMLMLDQIDQPYVNALRSRGISERRIVFRHVFRNALNPLISWSAAQVVGFFGGAVMIETIFGFPGIGRLMVDAVNNQDGNIVMAILMAVAATLLVVMLVADVMVAALDPRIRYGKG